MDGLIYTIAGALTVLAILGSNIVVAGGTSIAPLTAASLTTVGWIQANHGHPFRNIDYLFEYHRSLKIRNEVREQILERD